MKQQIINALQKSLSMLDVNEVNIDLNSATEFGDFSSNIAMQLAKRLGLAPKVLAQKIIDNFQCDVVEKIEIAGPGFMNFYLKNDSYKLIIESILELEDNYGSASMQRKINLEYVSANPTGYLHLGHVRSAALGATLANVLKFAGNKVDQEFYINDAGNQIDILGISSYTRYCQSFGLDNELPEDSYRGDDILDLALYLNKLWGDKYINTPYEECAQIFKDESKKWLLEKIKEHLSLIGVEFDIYSSEKEIRETDAIQKTLDKLKDHTYTQDGALWLKTTSLEDDKDRVLIKSDGSYTYLLPDIAYHDIKLSRGYDELINIWGADHIGYIARMQAALVFLGLPKDKLDILTIQLVKLIRDGKELKMSKRAGTSFTLVELYEMVGSDAMRFFMINRSNTTSLDFDINEAIEQSSDNPIFTIKYTHARANQLLNSSSLTPAPGNYEGKEIEVINHLKLFPDLILSISNNHKVHLLTQYLIDLAKVFNSWYSNSQVIGNAREASLLALVKATKQVIHNALKLLNIVAPEKM